MTQLRSSALAVFLVFAAICPAAQTESPDRARYMSVDEVRPGMKGFGRTVLSGAEITTFQVEVVSVMRNAYYAQQDVILIRCSGANLEHTGIIAGMSGSPVYLTDAEGNAPRMIGAVAYGWSLSKDPLCGVQPIGQMLSIPGVTSAPASRPAAASAGAGFPILNALAADARRTRLGPFFEGAERTPALPAPDRATAADRAGLTRLATPVMVAGMPPRTFDFVRERLSAAGFEPVPAGGFAIGQYRGGAVKLEPGAALCIPLLRGDSEMSAIGTCTEVVGDRIVGFGHALAAQGAIELPMATGAVHSVVATLSRSFKLGAPLDVVGTLFGDETTGIAGRLGEGPKMIPIEVFVDREGAPARYRFECLQDRMFTPMLLMAAVSDSIFSRSDLPIEHTVRYSLEVAFEGLGVFRSRNVTSQAGADAVIMEAGLAAMALMDNPFGRSRVESLKAEVRVEPIARAARMERAELVRDTLKPGDTVEVRVLWRPYRSEPVSQTYTLPIPADLAEGAYPLTIGSAQTQVAALRSEQPYLFRPERMADILDTLNRLASYSEDRVYLRLSLPGGRGLSVGRFVQPELPSFRRRIVADSKRTDVDTIQSSIVVDHPAPFAVDGARSFLIRVDRRADQ